MDSLEQRNIEAVARYYVTWGRGEVDKLGEHCTPDFVGHDPSGGPAFDLEGLKARLALFVQGMPDFRVTAEDTIAQGDRVVMRWCTRGTFTGTLMGRAPTGARLELTGITIYRVRDGRVAELWNESDALGLLTAIGAVAPPGG
jgi:predicted ester cyclase